MIYLTLTMLFSSLLCWDSKGRRWYRKKKITRILHHFFAQHNEAASKNGTASYKCLGTNKQGENRKYEDNLENLHGDQK